MGTITRKHPIVATAPLVLLFWGVAVLLVIAAHVTLDPISTVACIVAKTVALLAVAFAYMKFAAREATIDHALFVGATWLVLAIVMEIAMTSHAGHGWFELIGPPTSALRNLLMFAWILGPAIFAHARS
jgi:hypothetical protein